MMRGSSRWRCLQRRPPRGTRLRPAARWAGRRACWSENALIAARCAPPHLAAWANAPGLAHEGQGYQEKREEQAQRCGEAAGVAVGEGSHGVRPAYRKAAQGVLSGTQTVVLHGTLVPHAASWAGRPPAGPAAAAPPAGWLAAAAEARLPDARAARFGAFPSYPLHIGASPAFRSRGSPGSGRARAVSAVNQGDCQIVEKHAKQVDGGQVRAEAKPPCTPARHGRADDVAVRAAVGREVRALPPPPRVTFAVSRPPHPNRFCSSRAPLPPSGQADPLAPPAAACAWACRPRPRGGRVAASGCSLKIASEQRMKRGKHCEPRGLQGGPAGWGSGAEEGRASAGPNRAGTLATPDASSASGGWSWAVSVSLTHVRTKVHVGVNTGWLA